MTTKNDPAGALLPAEEADALRARLAEHDAAQARIARAEAAERVKPVRALVVKLRKDMESLPDATRNDPEFSMHFGAISNGITGLEVMTGLIDPQG